MKSNEEIIYQIIKKRALVLILVPLLMVGGYFAYSRLSSSPVYSASTSLLVNSESDVEYSTERNQSITHALRELVKTTTVLESANQIVPDLSLQQIKSMISVTVDVNANIAIVTVRKSSRDGVLELVRTLGESVTEVANDIYGDGVVQIIDVATSVQEEAPSLSRTRLIGIAGISFVVTLFLVLGLSWKKEA